MSFKQHLLALGEAVDAHLGEIATWSGIDDPVRVHDEQADDTARYGDTEVILNSRVIRVRQALVPMPAHGDAVTLLGSGEVLTVSGDPILDAEGYWACTV